MQLYGATLVDKKMDLGAAIRIWNEAMTYGRPSGIATPIDVYDNLVELDSFSDIRNVVGDPDAIRMQVASSSEICFPLFFLICSLRKFSKLSATLKFYKLARF